MPVNSFAMDKTLRSVSHISFIFFVLFGALHLAASMLLVQGVSGSAVTLIVHTLDLPFLFAGLIYGSSRLSLHLGHITGNLKSAAIVCSAGSAVLFLSALILNFILPDVQL